MAVDVLAPAGVRAVAALPDAEVVAYCFGGNKMIVRVGERVHVWSVEARRQSKRARVSVCTWVEWQAGFRPPRIGRLVDGPKPVARWCDSERLEVVEGGGWPFWGPSDGVVLDDRFVFGSYRPKHQIGV